MNSFDVFDTLLARRYLTSDPVWQHLETEFAIPNFMQKRKAADTGSRSLYEIYDALVAQGDITAKQKDALIRREIELEISISIPVQKNLNKVQHGDILISDMYMPASAILQLARSVGLDKQVTLYQSNSDKSTGAVWPKFKTVRPGYHLGDNYRSDCESPKQAGFNGVWFNPATGFNTYEQEFFNSGLANIALLTREIRLATDYADTEEKYFNLANNINLPLLFITAELLRRHTSKNIVFLGRDCQQLYRLYNAYFDVGYYLPFSRKVAYDQPEAALNYLRVHAPDNAIYFDISSTGATWEKLGGNIDVAVAIYSDVDYYTPKKPSTPDTFFHLTKNSEIGATNLMLEVMNCADHGHLNYIDVQQDRLMQVQFGEPELPAAIINVIHEPVKRAVNLAHIYRDAVRTELAGMSVERLIENFGMLAGTICSQHDMLNEMTLFLEKETEYLDQFTNENS